MNISSIEENKRLKVILEGRFDSNTAGTFDAYLEDKLSEKEKLIIDMTGIDYISSTGLRSLIKVKKMMGGKPVAISNPSDTVTEVLELAGFCQIFIIER